MSASLSSLPVVVKLRILTYLIHQEPAIIHDFPANGAILASGTRQTTYETAFGRTTYFALESCPTRREIHEHHQFTSYSGLATQMLLVDRQWYRLGVGLLYDRTFAFAGSAASCLAFLHDHRQVQQHIERCTIFVSPAASEYGPATILEDWRRLFNVLVHERDDLRHLRLVIRKEFWFVTDWDAPLDLDPVCAVFEAESSCQRLRGEEKNFLQHVARLAPQRVRLEVRIEESSHSADRQAFANALESAMLQEQSYRPDLITGRIIRTGTCRTRELERSCYGRRFGQWEDC